MKQTYKDVLKHSGVYGLGEILRRFASLLLLPVYTFYLRPADYGCIAILDLTVGILEMFIVDGMIDAVNRYHFEATTDSERDAVWWTGGVVVAVTGVIVLLPLGLFRSQIGEIVLGAEYPSGGLFFGLVLATLWFASVNKIPETYFRVRKWSGLFVSLSLGGLLFNVALNVALLRNGWGITGVLFGNLATNVVFCVVRSLVMIASLGPFQFHRLLVRKLWIFAGPLVANGLLALLMHQMDRYLLRGFLDMHEVGVYSLAYAIGQGVIGVVLSSFHSIWSVAVYEIAKEPQGRAVYPHVFRYFVYATLVIALGVSVFARPLLALVAAADYAAAADLIPVVCFAYVLFGLEGHFAVPALLAKRTAQLVPAFVVGCILNFAANLVLIPRMGTAGAAWASVLTFAAFSLTSLFMCRRIERFAYPLIETAAVAAGIVSTYVIYRIATHLLGGSVLIIAAGGLACLAWGICLFGPLIQKFPQWPRRLVADPEAESSQPVAATASATNAN